MRELLAKIMFLFCVNAAVNYSKQIFINTAYLQLRSVRHHLNKMNATTTDLVHDAAPIGRPASQTAFSS